MKEHRGNSFLHKLSTGGWQGKCTKRRTTQDQVRASTCVCARPISIVLVELLMEGGQRYTKRARTEEPEDCPAIHVAAEPPLSAKPEVPGLTEFWEQLRDAEFEVDTRVLRFRVPIPLPDLKRLRCIYVRKCYEQLAAFAHQMRRDDEGPGSHPIGRGMYVKGTPRIGKSVWMLYLLWDLAKKEKIVVLQYSARTRILFTSEGAFKGDERAFDDELEDMEAFYLVDGHKPDIASAKTILACDPVHGLYGKF